LLSALTPVYATASASRLQHPPMTLPISHRQAFQKAGVPT